MTPSGSKETDKILTNLAETEINGKAVAPGTEPEAASKPKARKPTKVF